MSGHADTIRRALQEFDDEVPQGNAPLARDALAALDALVAENQQLRDALTENERFLRGRGFSRHADAARAALAGTPSEDTE